VNYSKLKKITNSKNAVVEKKPSFTLPSFGAKNGTPLTKAAVKKATIKKQPSTKKAAAKVKKTVTKKPLFAKKAAVKVVKAKPVPKKTATKKPLFAKKADVKGSKAKAAPVSKKAKNITTTKSPALKVEFPKLGNVKAPELPGIPSLPELPSLSLPSVSSPVGIAGFAMGTLSPLFAFEAKVQAGVLVNIVDFLGVPFRVYPDEIRSATKKRVSSSKPVMYTYGLSPFSGEAKKVLDQYDVEIIELGAEWFLLGPGASEQRLALADNSPNLQTSLPHLFVNGESLGGLSTGGRDNAGILGLEKSGDLEKLLKKKVRAKNAK